MTEYKPSGVQVLLRKLIEEPGPNNLVEMKVEILEKEQVLKMSDVQATGHYVAGLEEYIQGSIQRRAEYLRIKLSRLSKS